MIEFLARLYIKHYWFKQMADQTAHFAWGTAAALPTAVYGAPAWVVALMPLIIALPREFWDQRPIRNAADTLLDIAVFGISGCTTVLFFL